MLVRIQLVTILNIIVLSYINLRIININIANLRGRQYNIICYCSNDKTFKCLPYFFLMLMVFVYIKVVLLGQNISCLLLFFIFSNTCRLNQTCILFVENIWIDKGLFKEKNKYTDLNLWLIIALFKQSSPLILIQTCSYKYQQYFFGFIKYN